MSKSLLIQKKDNITKIYLDGTEVCDVISYELTESADSVPVIKLGICITGDLEAQM